ncbi:MAG: NAD(P) transhydrogenase subunit alpha [Alphaproteobacteria bacterium]|nr:NAD(P) transhydrogenase subunit alpha [Alphaproteobacteria bacterium]
MYDLLCIFVLSAFVGYLVILNVTPALYSPLMSISNAISGIIILGAITSTGNNSWRLVAVFMASLNIFGGFAISAHMLSMFKQKEKRK